jgi:FkbM family methyltransferase
MSRALREIPGLAPPVLDPSSSALSETDIGRLYLRRTRDGMASVPVESPRRGPEKAALLRAELQPGASIVDVGAGVGYFSILASAIVGPSGRVLAVEPEARNLELLRANAWLHRAWNLQVLPVAARPETGYARRGSSVVSEGDQEIVDESANSDALAPGVRLDEVLSDVPVDIVRVDVGGSEHEVVAGLSDTIATNPGLVLICEFWPAALEQMGIDPRAVLSQYQHLGLHLGMNGRVSVSSEEILAACNVGNTASASLVLRTVVSPTATPVVPTEAIPEPGAPPARGRWDPIFYQGWEQVIPDRSMWVGPEDPVSHFLRWPFEYLAYLTLLCDLKRDDSVLEVGCNHGRTMLALLDYLRPPGRYEGFDILASHIAFASEHIQSPSFKFSYADIYNDAYNPTGAIDAADYRFPYEDGSFDCAYAASVYTHLLPAATANYLQETRRVLKDGGRCLYSFFILDFYEGTGTSAHPLYEFDGRLEGMDGVGVRDVQTPSAVIAYERAYLEELASEAGLRVARVLPGYWSAQGNYAVNEQDLVVLEAV